MAQSGIAKLKKTIRVFTGAQESGRAAARTKASSEPLEDALVLAYTRGRLRFQPDYVPLAPHRASLLKAQRALAESKVPSTMWAAYVRFVFETFPTFTQCQYPPPNVLSSSHFIEQFRATRLRRQTIDPVRAELLLVKQGFAPAAMDPVLALATRLLEQRPLPPALDPVLAEMAKFVADNINRIGTVECA